MIPIIHETQKHNTTTTNIIYYYSSSLDLCVRVQYHPMYRVYIHLNNLSLLSLCSCSRDLKSSI